MRVPVVGTVLLARVAGFRPVLNRLRDVLGLVVLAAGFRILVSATIGVTSGWLGGVISAAMYGETWRTWWLGDAIGDLVRIGNAHGIFVPTPRERAPWAPRRHLPADTPRLGCSRARFARGGGTHRSAPGQGLGRRSAATAGARHMSQDEVWEDRQGRRGGKAREKAAGGIILGEHTNEAQLCRMQAASCCRGD